MSSFGRDIRRDLGRAFWRDLVGHRHRGLAFADVTVYPTQSLGLSKAFGVFRGGPDWPYFPAQTILRHCRGPLPIPVDSRPDTAQRAVTHAGNGLWCGPITHHFGHMIADFGMRVAASSRFDPTAALVFSLRDQPGPSVPAFFWHLIDHLGIARERLYLVAEPTRFERLRALPQAERIGSGPSRAHLALMDAMTVPAPEGDIPFAYVSRARLPHGRFAGEAVLDAALAAASVTVFHPETATLTEQLAFYRRARHLVFAEGSALHALQLLGHVGARVTVLVRRARTRLAAASLAPRVQSLDYLNALRGCIHGLRPDGTPQAPTGISLLDEVRLLEGFARLGIDLAAQWDSTAFARACEADLTEWVARRAAKPWGSAERALIEKRLRAMAIRVG